MADGGLAARRAKAKRRKKKRRKITAGQASLKMYFQPRHTWRRSVEVSSDESGSEGEERSARNNTDPSADGRVQQAIGRMPDRGVARREARARSRQARAMAAGGREVRSRDDGGRKRAGGWWAARRKRRRVISDSDSDDDGDESGEGDGEGDEHAAHNPNTNDEADESSAAARSKTSGPAAMASRAAAAATSTKATAEETRGSSLGDARESGRGAGAATRRGGGGGKEGWVL